MIKSFKYGKKDYKNLTILIKRNKILMFKTILIIVISYQFIWSNSFCFCKKFYEKKN